MDLLHSPTKAQWERIGVKHHHGIALPLFSLRSSKSSGIGEFCDLLPLIDWCQEIGYDTIQLLPLNDTGIDTSPYSALSALALNPIHLSLWNLPEVEKYSDLQPLLKELETLNLSQRCDYPTVQAGKNAFLRTYYHYVKDAILSGSDYKVFLEKNGWVLNYALFKALKEKFNWKPWSTWGADYCNVQEERLQELLKEYKNEISFHIFLQFLCFHQFREVKKHAEEKKIFMMGDIPILIDRESADVWLYPHLFDLNYSAGAPPDMYSQDGQNWGFPLYNWVEIEKEDFQWWKERLKVAEPFYDIYRLDHIVGFYRIWAIKDGLAGRFGEFIPHDNWVTQGEKILRVLLENCKMLPIGEDLGTIPPEVRVSMHQLGILGTKVMRWERVWNEDRRFIKPEDYSVESMTTVSTHDSETLLLWWEVNREDALDFAKFKGWEYKLPLNKEQAYEILQNSHHTASLFHINPLQEYLALVDGMTWPHAEDERINIPGLISPRNWSYRFKPSVEEITSNPILNKKMKAIIQ
jgi:4-alpha-glucanotransferase